MAEAARPSETLVNLYQLTWHYNPEDSHLRPHCRENIKSYLVNLYNSALLNKFWKIVLEALLLYCTWMVYMFSFCCWVLDIPLYTTAFKHRKMNTRFGTCNVTSLCRIGSLKTVARKLGKCKLNLVGVQEVRWEKGGTERAKDYTFLYEQRNRDHQLETGFFVRKRILSAVRTVEFISDRMS
jgi:hypothetical protein